MNENEKFEKWYGTTIVSVRKKNEVVIAGEPRSAVVRVEPAYDPQSLRPRSDVEIEAVA